MSLYHFVTIAISLSLSLSLCVCVWQCTHHSPFPHVFGHLCAPFNYYLFLTRIPELYVLIVNYLLLLQFAMIRSIPSISNYIFAADSRKRILTPSVISRNIQWGNNWTLLPNHVYAEHGLLFFSLRWPLFTVCHIIACILSLFCRPYFQNICFNGYMVIVSAWFQVINDLLDPTGQNLRVREDSQVSHYTLILIEILLLLLLIYFFIYL
jgi:hypothetical protein